MPDVLRNAAKRGRERTPHPLHWGLNNLSRGGRPAKRRQPNVIRGLGVRGINPHESRSQRTPNPCMGGFRSRNVDGRMAGRLIFSSTSSRREMTSRTDSRPANDNEAIA